MIKTNAMRFLDTHKCAYEIVTYDNPTGFIEVSEVARIINQKPESVFKTLITVGTSKKNYVFVVPAGFDLDLKKAAKACGEKNVELLSMKLLFQTTGYIHGGCSPIGMKKAFPVYIDDTAQNQEKIYISAGKVGVSVGLSPIDLANTIRAQFVDLKMK